MVRFENRAGALPSLFHLPGILFEETALLGLLRCSLRPLMGCSRTPFSLSFVFHVSGFPKGESCFSGVSLRPFLRYFKISYPPTSRQESSPLPRLLHPFHHPVVGKRRSGGLLRCAVDFPIFHPPSSAIPPYWVLTLTPAPG